MPKSHTPYAPEFRRQMVELVRTGRNTPNELSREFGCSSNSIRKWVRQSDLDAGRREDGLSTDEREELRRVRRENRQLREPHESSKKGGTLVRTGDRFDTTEVFELMRANQALHQVRTMCGVLGVSPSGYYAWREREPSARGKVDEELKERIAAIHKRSRATYGVPRVHAQLMAEGERGWVASPKISLKCILTRLYSYVIMRRTSTTRPTTSARASGSLISTVVRPDPSARIARLMRAAGSWGGESRPAHAHDRARSRCPPGTVPSGARIQRRCARPAVGSRHEVATVRSSEMPEPIPDTPESIAGRACKARPRRSGLPKGSVNPAFG